MDYSTILNDPDGGIAMLKRFITNLDTCRNAIEVEIIGENPERAIKEIDRLMRYINGVGNNAELRESLDFARYQLNEMI